MKCQSWITIVVATGLSLSNGCAKGPAMGEIHGTVTLDDKPVEEGTIRLIPVDGRTSMGAANIKQGMYEMRLPAKTYRVEISWPKLPPNMSTAGKYTTDPKEDYIVPELIPAKYNTRSELTLEVTPGFIERHFDLRSR